MDEFKKVRRSYKRLVVFLGRKPLGPSPTPVSTYKHWRKYVDSVNLYRKVIMETYNICIENWDDTSPAEMLARIEEIFAELIEIDGCDYIKCMNIDGNSYICGYDIILLSEPRRRKCYKIGRFLTYHKVNRLCNEIELLLDQLLTGKKEPRIDHGTSLSPVGYHCDEYMDILNYKSNIDLNVCVSVIGFVIMLFLLTTAYAQQGGLLHI